MAFSLDNLKKLNKDKKFNSSIYDPTQKVEALISTGSVALDKVIGIGGYPKGRLTEIYGNTGAGKTTLALHAVKSAQEKNLPCIFLDFEHTFDNTYAQNLGINLSPTELLVQQFYNLNDAWDFLNEHDSLVRDCGLVIFDSVAMMKPRKSQEGGSDDSKQIGAHAKIVTDFLLWWVPRCKNYNITTILINQERNNLEALQNRFSSDPKLISTGGKGLSFFNSVKIHVRSRKPVTKDIVNPLTGDVEAIPVQTSVIARCEKNKVGHPYLKCEFDIIYGKGIDNLSSLIKAATCNGLIEKAGPWMSYTSVVNGEVLKAQGYDNFIKLFDNPIEREGLMNWFLRKDIKFDPNSVLSMPPLLESDEGEDLGLESALNIEEGSSPKKKQNKKSKNTTSTQLDLEE